IHDRRKDLSSCGALVRLYQSRQHLKEHHLFVFTEGGQRLRIEQVAGGDRLLRLRSRHPPSSTESLPDWEAATSARQRARFASRLDCREKFTGVSPDGSKHL